MLLFSRLSVMVSASFSASSTVKPTFSTFFELFDSVFKMVAVGVKSKRLLIGGSFTFTVLSAFLTFSMPSFEVFSTGLMSI